MLVTEQVDAMRAMGTDPSRKLVTPRVIAAILMQPLLTGLADSSACSVAAPPPFFRFASAPSNFGLAPFMRSNSATSCRD